MCPNKGKKKFSKVKAAVQDETVQPTATELSSTCCVPRGQVSCPSPDLLDKSSSIHVLCSNPQCPQSGLIHQKCFDKFESLAVMVLGKHARCRGWSEKQKFNSIWKTRGVHSSYDLIFKICACECCHGHIRRDLEFEGEVVEGAGVVQADQEKRKKNKSEVVRPKLNIRRVNISQLSVGNFSYNKHIKTGKSPQLVVDRLDEDDIDSCDNNSSIPGLQPSQTPLTLKLNLSDLKPIKERIKVKKTSVSESSSILEEDEGWTKVSKGSPDHGETADISVMKSIEEDMISSEQILQNTEELLEVYQSDDEIVDSSYYNFMLDSRGDSANVNGYPETFVKGLSPVSYGSNCVQTNDVYLGVNALQRFSSEQLEEIWINLGEEKLFEETDKKKALAEVSSLVEQNRAMSIAFLTEKNAFLTEKKRLLGDILSLNQSNMELREVSEARENRLQVQIDELKTLLTDEVYSKKLVLEQNENLNRLIQCIEDDKENKDASLEVAKMEWKEQILQAAALVKAHEMTALEMLEREKLEMLKSAQTMEDRLKGLSSTVDTMKEKIENISMTNLQSDEKLAIEKNLVKDLREQLEAERKTGMKTMFEKVKEVITKNDLPGTTIQQILRKLEADVNPDLAEEFSQDQKYEVLIYNSMASQSTTSTASMLSTSQDNSMLMEALQITREETRQTVSKVDMLEGMVKALQGKQMVMEKKLTSSKLGTTGSGNTRIDSLNEKIRGLIRNCDQYEAMTNRLSGFQDRADQQIEALGSGVDQQMLENISLRTEFVKFKEKMVAFEDEMMSDRKQRQSWAACNWL